MTVSKTKVFSFAMEMQQVVRYLYVLCGSQNKQRLFPYTALTDCFYNLDGMCLLRGTD